MRFVETLDLTDTDPKKYVGPPKVDKKSGKPLCKNGKEPDEEGNCVNDLDMHDEEVPDEEIANKHEGITAMKTTNPILRQELMNLGIILPKDKPAPGLSEDSPVRTALNIMRNSPNTIESTKANKEVNTSLDEAYKLKTQAIDKEKAAKEGAEAAKRAKETIAAQRRKKNESIIW